MFRVESGSQYDGTVVELLGSPPEDCLVRIRTMRPNSGRADFDIPLAAARELHHLLTLALREARRPR